MAERTKELQAKLAELERFNRVAVGRELQMIELKNKIAQSEGQLKDTSDGLAATPPPASASWQRPEHENTRTQEHKNMKTK